MSTFKSSCGEEVEGGVRRAWRRVSVPESGDSRYTICRGTKANDRCEIGRVGHFLGDYFASHEKCDCITSTGIKLWFFCGLSSGRQSCRSSGHGPIKRDLGKCHH